MVINFLNKNWRNYCLKQGCGAAVRKVCGQPELVIDCEKAETNRQKSIAPSIMPIDSFNPGVSNDFSFWAFKRFPNASGLSPEQYLFNHGSGFDSSLLSWIRTLAFDVKTWLVSWVKLMKSFQKFCEWTFKFIVVF